MTNNIRLAEPSDLPVILGIYAEARVFMAANGNASQWGTTRYPREELLKQDIENGRLYVLEHEGRIAAVFVLFIGEEPTYRVIRDGAWPNDRPYMTVHRLASRTEEHGTAAACLDFAVKLCKEKGLGLRADTHRDNSVVRHILEKYGFVYCGVINVADGTERLAYQLRM